MYEGTGTNPSYPPVLLEVCFLNTEYLVSVPLNYVPLTKILNPERSKVISSLEGGAVKAAALLGLYAIFTLFRIVEY